MHPRDGGRAAGEADRDGCRCASASPPVTRGARPVSCVAQKFWLRRRGRRAGERSAVTIQAEGRMHPRDGGRAAGEADRDGCRCASASPPPRPSPPRHHPLPSSMAAPRLARGQAHGLARRGDGGTSGEGRRAMEGRPASKVCVAAGGQATLKAGGDEGVEGRPLASSPEANSGTETKLMHRDGGVAHAPNRGGIYIR
jgi:hypothetical protein